MIAKIGSTWAVDLDLWLSSLTKFDIKGGVEVFGVVFKELLLFRCRVELIFGARTYLSFIQLWR